MVVATLTSCHSVQCKETNGRETLSEHSESARAKEPIDVQQVDSKHRSPSSPVLGMVQTAVRPAPHQTRLPDASVI